jgi:hypothetical protein
VPGEDRRDTDYSRGTNLREATVARAVEVLLFWNIIVMGLSHVVRPHAWVDFFILLRGKGHAGVFLNALLNLSLGSLIVAFHDEWTGLPVVVTLFGAINLAKAFVAFVFPRLAFRSLERVSHERASEFVIAGSAFLAFGAVIGYGLWLA